MRATAPAKLILCGEHAVVYGRPAIALPVADIRARAEVRDGAPGSGIVFAAPDLARRWSLADAPDDPLSVLVSATLAYLRDGATKRRGAEATSEAPTSAPLVARLSASSPPASHLPLLDLLITITSAIPIASGMGSGAAVATAVVRALAAHRRAALTPAEISALVYASEQRLHGTPSGIDNTVVAWEQPIWFTRGQGTGDRGQGTDRLLASHQSPVTSHQSSISSLVIAAPLTLLIGDTGVRSATRLPVGEVRRRWQAAPPRYEALFDSVGAVVAQVRVALAAGDSAALGALLDENHALLCAIGVSSPELDALVGAARAAGALGAKLSGAGWGGVMLALVAPDTQQRVAGALRAAGAARVLATSVAATGAA